MSRRQIGPAVGVVAIFVGLVALPFLEPNDAFGVGGVGLAVSFGAVGALLTRKRPDNAMGWIFLVVALSQGLSASTWPAYERWQGTGLGDALGWITVWCWVPGFGSLATFALLLFPNGRLPAPRWRPAAWLAVAAMVLMGGPMAVAAWPARGELEVFLSDAEATSPFAEIAQTANDVGMLVLLVAAIASIGAIVTRFRRSRGVERLQLKWFVAGAVLEVTGLFAVSVVAYADGNALGSWAVLVATLLLTPLLPVAVGLAVLRYRLYDIDRIVSRTVSYGLLTVLLVAVYAAGVVGLGGLARQLTGGGGDLAVAASTLAVAGLFGPARRRIQRGVDRRFNRARYDAARTVEAFGQRLRDEVDLDALAGALGGAVAASVAPASVSLWLPGGSGPDAAVDVRA